MTPPLRLGREEGREHNISLSFLGASAGCRHPEDGGSEEELPFYTASDHTCSMPWSWNH